MNEIGNFSLPVLIAFIIVFGLIRCKGGVFSIFLDGAKSGIKTAIGILPSLVGLVTAVEMFKASGASDLLCSAVLPITNMLRIPERVVPLLILRPVSGSGAIALLDNILKQYGADSIAGRTASVICASGETTFYTSTVYYGSVGVKKIRHTMIAALIADFVSVIVSSVTVNVMFG